MMDVRTDYFSWKKRHEYNQHEAAEAIGCSRAAIASFESARSPYPKGETLLKMLAVLYPQYGDVSVRRNTYKCQHCGVLVPGPLDHASHCCECGEKLGEGCRACGNINLLGGKFCSQCGAKLA